jgi:hypothetical protein
MNVDFLSNDQWQVTTPEKKQLKGNHLQMMTILKGHCGLGEATTQVLGTMMDLEMKAAKEQQQSTQDALNKASQREGEFNDIRQQKEYAEQRANAVERENAQLKAEVKRLQNEMAARLQENKVAQETAPENAPQS